ncbi:MAG: NADH-quinone oxidoreductase subunit H [Nanoarchaeota archaeon]|nr:NADH-quinone oxidoreductase subunit H [Nanoarchaeota archaeon]MCG2717471.1 NADH-quinone oxidoreductase subunit H [Nanoarchaeota archaeon]
MNLDPNIVKILYILLIVPFALVMEGIRRKAVARMQNRIGPPITQPIYDILKLFQKKKSDTLAQENSFFKVVPFLTFCVAFSFFLFIPLSFISFKHDFIFLIYLLVLESALFVLAGFAGNNPYSAIASMRELILMVSYEMIFTIIILTLFVYEEVLMVSEFGAMFMLLKLPIAFICFIAVMAIEIRITPYDTAAAPTEVLEGVETEYSGKGLAFLHISDALKLTFFAVLFIYFFFGQFSLPWMLLFVPLAVVFFSFVQATTGRYRVDQTFKRLTFFLILILIEFVRIKFITW